MAIIVLNHYVSRQGIVESYHVFNLNNNIGHIFRCTGYPALVTFVLISGYFMAGNGKYKSSRILSLLVQVTAFSLVCLLVGGTVLHIQLNSGMVIKSIIPYFYGYDAYWFVGPYLGMCLLAPFMDKLINAMNKGEYTIFLLMSVILVFVIPTWRPFSMANERNGILTFVVIYAIAGFIKKFRLEENISKSKLLMIITGFWAISYSTYPMGHYLNIEIFNNTVLDMNNIFAVVIGVSFFLLFLKLSVNTNRFINYIAGSAFGIYLFHDNFILRDWIWGYFVKRELYYDSSLFVLHCLLVVSALFVIGVVVDILIGYLIKPVLESVKVNEACASLDCRLNRPLGEETGVSSESARSA